MNHTITGMPAWNVLPVMVVKLMILAMIAGLTAEYFKKVSITLLVGVVLVSMALGALGELLFTGGITASIQDVTVGWPGILLQVLGSWLILKYVK